MSRGFVREEDQEEAPFIPPRATLPAGVTNYVTPAGYEQLLQERNELESNTKLKVIKDEKEKRHLRAVTTRKLNLLNERITTARVIDPKGQPKEEVRFGARVKFKIKERNLINNFQIVGVDEANIKNQKIAFIAPLAKALTGKKVGELAEFHLAGQLSNLEIMEINYF